MRRALVLVLACGAAAAAQGPGPILPAALLAHVKWLSSDELRGRGNGMEGLERAAGYVRDQFRSAGLQGPIDGGFEQPFDAEVRIEPPASTTLDFDASGVRSGLALARDFYPLSILDRRPEVAAPALDRLPVVFAGYGISAPDLAYDDFAGLDVHEAAVLVFTHEPQEHDERSLFDGRNLTPGAALSQKAREASNRGARLLMVVEDPSHAEDRATRTAWWNDPQGENMGIPVVRVSRDGVAAAVPGLDLYAASARIDRTVRPESRRLDDVRVSYVEHRAQFTARLRNIVGVLPGADPATAREAVVIGAHYDHIGTGGELSEAPDSTGQVHNGADDNASGVAALIEIARAAARARPRLRRSVVFVAFAGEELGLLGAEHYVTAPVIALARTRAMINLDMVGRSRGRVLAGLFGPTLPGVSMARLRSWTSLAVQDFGRGGYTVEESDVGPFVRRGVPALAFFTGFHSDYHRPSDDWPAVDAEGGAAVANLALRLVQQVAQNASAAR